MFKLLAPLVLLSALYTSSYAATVSLFIPGVDAGDESFTGDYLGTDSSGHTSWRIGVMPTSVPSLSSGVTAVFPSATLVAGPSDAHLTADIPEQTINGYENCAIASGIASCTVVLENPAGSTTFTGVEVVTASPVPVRVPDSGPGALPNGAAPSRALTGGAVVAGAITVLLVSMF